MLQTLILAPTREVALQITGVLKKISFNMKIKCFPFIGGQSVNDDISKLGQCQIAVGTPGTPAKLNIKFFNHHVCNFEQAELHI